MGWMTSIRFSAEAMKGLFFLRHRVQTSSGSHSASFQ